MDFQNIFMKAERIAILPAFDTEASNFQARLQFMVAFRKW